MLKPRIFLTFRHYKGGSSSTKRTGRLYPRRNPWYSLSEAESTSGHMVLLCIYINSTNIPPIMLINRIYGHQNLLSLQLVSFLVGLRTYQHPCITYSECVSVALVIQNARRMHRIILSSVVCPAVQHFYTSHKRHDFRKKKSVNTKCVF